MNVGLKAGDLGQDLAQVEFQSRLNATPLGQRICDTPSSVQQGVGIFIRYDDGWRLVSASWPPAISCDSAISHGQFESVAPPPQLTTQDLLKRGQERLNEELI